jgi:tetratricopeptide (TPR) repeat protein/DNA-binding SARP family transcriptional activator
MTEFTEGMVEFRILGPVELRVGDQSYPLGSPKERCVLAILLWDLGLPVATGTLIERVWGQDLPDRPHACLYGYVSRLRRRLREASGNYGGPGLRWHSGYYTLDAKSESVDLFQFRRLRVQARAIADSGDAGQAASLLRDAEKLWRGEPLAGLSGAWADRVRLGLAEERLAAVRHRVELELRLGRHADLVGEISALAAQHPFDQALAGQLMIALYRSGRQAEALETYRRLRRRLSAELGSDPGSGLRILHERMLNDDPELGAEIARPTTSSTPANSLPRDNPDFSGRVAELNTLFGVLKPNSKLTRSVVTVLAISGMPGVGKSTLAIHTAHILRDRYPHQLYLDLHTHHPTQEPVDPASGLGILLRTLNVAPARIPATLQERTALWRTQLANRRTLIVLDDANDADQIRPLLPGVGDCLVLITCRRRMIGLPGIFWLQLNTLPIDEAVTLFTQVAGPDRVTDTTAAASVARLCGCLPLAIHLTGNRFRNHPAWSVADLVSRLHHSRHLLDEIHTEDREVAASFELSHQYLTNGQQRLFRRIALHPGVDFSIHAANAAAGDESFAATEQTLDALLDYHLVEEHAPGRFTFHDLIRKYARHRALADEKNMDQRLVVHQILDYYLYVAERAASTVYPFHRRLAARLTHIPAAPPLLSTKADFQEWVAAERINLVAIVHYAVQNNWVQHAGLLPHMLAQFLDTWGYWEDAVALHHLAVRMWHETGDAHGEASALIDLCFALGRTGRHKPGLQCAQSALDMFRTQGDQMGEADALDRMGIILWQASRYQEALSCHADALAIRIAIQDRHGEADAFSHSAMSLWHTNRYTEALNYLRKALEIYREIDDPRGEGTTLNNIADMQRHLGFYEEALDRYQQALVISRDIGDRQGEAILFSNIGNVCLHTGRLGESVNYYRKALSVYRDIGDRRCEADALDDIGAAFQLSGHFSEALIHHQKALVLARELAEPYKEVRSLSNMGNAELADNKYLSAADDYRAALELSLQIGDAYQEGLAEDGLGSVLLHTEGDAAARRHWQKALGLLERLGVPEAEVVRNRLQTINVVPSG